MKKELGMMAVGALAAVVLAGSGVLWAGDIQTDGKLVSTASKGPPIEVTSTEMVDNLNADQLDGLEGGDLYMRAEVDALIASLQSQIGMMYTQAEVDALIASLESQIGMLYTQEEVDALVAALQVQIDQLTTDLGSYQSLLELHEPIFEIKDSAGTSVGLVRSFPHSNYAKTVIWDGDVFFDVWVGENSILLKDELTDTISFSEPGCTGQAYIDPPNENSLVEKTYGYTHAFGSSSVVYRSMEGDTPEAIYPWSFWSRATEWDGTTTDYCNPSSGTYGGLQVRAVEYFDFADFGFQPPFEVVRSPEQKPAD